MYLNQCQTADRWIFAENSNLNYSTYYVSYTISVIISRIFLAGYLRKLGLAVGCNSMLLVMCIALVMFAFVGQNEFLYMLSSVLLGIGYGLAYPVLKAWAVENLLEPTRSAALVYFSLSYFLGLYLFPWFAGPLIVQYGYKSMLGVIIFLGIAELGIGLYAQGRHCADAMEHRSRVA